MIWKPSTCHMLLASEYCAEKRTFEKKKKNSRWWWYCSESCFEMPRVEIERFKKKRGQQQREKITRELSPFPQLMV